MDYELVKGSLDVDIADVKDDSRKVEENDLYIAKVGSTSNSHKFIPDAIKKGADGTRQRSSSSLSCTDAAPLLYLFIAPYFVA